MNLLNKFIGNSGEKYVEKYLKSCGYRVIARQHKEKYVEIDIIAEKDKKIYLFEVKTVSREIENSKSVSQRNGKDGRISGERVESESTQKFNVLEKIHSRKLEKMYKFADFYLNNHVDYEGIEIGIAIVKMVDSTEKPCVEVYWV